jgi:hypothetical protein
MTATASATQSRSRVWRRRIALTVALAMALPAVVYLRGSTGHQDALEQAIIKLQFFPVRPPSILRGPGSFYHVDVNGNILDTVCQADQVLVGSLAQESETTLVVASALQNAGYAIDGNILEKINARLNAKQLHSVRYELRDVRVIEVAQANLLGVSKRLLMDPNCESKISEFVHARELVCQGASVLLASADYQVQLEQSLKAESMAKGDLQIVSEVLRENRIDDSSAVKPALGKAQVSSSASDEGSNYRLTSGKNLYYGIKVSPLCVTPKEASRAWRVPRNRVERVIYRLWQLSPV